MATEYPDIIIPTCKTPDEISPMVSDLQGFSLGCRTIMTCRKASAARNRNIGLAAAKTGIVIMLDDDIGGFSGGWWEGMIKPLVDDPGIMMVSARLLKPDRTPGPMMFGGDREVPLAPVPRVPTACIAFRNDGTRFDDGTLPDSLDKEGFIGSGFEDDDFCARLAERYPGARVVINNGVKLVHFNDMKNQHGKFWQHNKARFDKIWISEGTRRIRRARPPAVDQFWDIPKILHFVWMGPPMPEWAKDNIAEFRRLNPGFEVKIHDQGALNPMFKDAWNRIPKQEQHALAMQSDLIRLSVLMEFGGWYWDCDFWPLVSIEEMCKGIVGAVRRPVLFANEDRTIVANGVIGCRREDLGLLTLANKVTAFRAAPPKWWDYGTMVTHNGSKEYPDLFSLHDLKLIIPVTGKAAAREVMSSPEKISAVAASGAWAIHFEMQTTTDFV